MNISNNNNTYDHLKQLNKPYYQNYKINKHHQRTTKILKITSKQWIQHYQSQKLKNQHTFQTNSYDISTRVNFIQNILKSTQQTPAQSQIRQQKRKPTFKNICQTIKNKKKLTQENQQVAIKKLHKMVNSTDKWNLSKFTQNSQIQQIFKHNQKDQSINNQNFNKFKQMKKYKSWNDHKDILIQNHKSKNCKYQKRIFDIKKNQSRKNKQLQIEEAKKINSLRKYNQQLKKNAQINFGVKFSVKNHRNGLEKYGFPFYADKYENFGSSNQQKFHSIQQKSLKIEEISSENQKIPICFMNLIKNKSAAEENLLKILRKGHKTADTTKRIKYIEL